MFSPANNVLASSHEEYLQWIQQAMTEVDDLRDAIQFAQENLGEETFLDVLQRELEQLAADLQSGNYQHQDSDLALADIVQQTPASLLPFRQLLLNINATHRSGYNRIH